MQPIPSQKQIEDAVFGMAEWLYWEEGDYNLPGGRIDVPKLKTRLMQAPWPHLRRYYRGELDLVACRYFSSLEPSEREPIIDRALAAWVPPSISS